VKQTGRCAKDGRASPAEGQTRAPRTRARQARPAAHSLVQEYYQERAAAPSRRVNYAALDVEELGSVYESLLEFHPDVAVDASGRLQFDLIFGSERKTTGSFYTPPELVNELIESALVPVVRQRLAAAAIADKRDGGAKHQQAALLSLKIIDVACGSGHMLLAAARRVGKELARLDTGEDEPAPERVRESIRDVISHCVYGVDRNPLAVDLCRVALWLESHTAGKPLTFLDHRIRCGDSLVGVFNMDALFQGIPDKAFDACEGDDKAAARVAARQNREERRGFQDLFALRDSGESEAITRHSRDVDAIPDDSPELIRRKKNIFENSHRDPAWLRRNQACDLWTAAFFQTLDADSVVITSAALADHLDGRPIDARLHARAQTLALHQPFFHWPLEFPEVFAPKADPSSIAAPREGGFDVVLSNPPWERIKLQEQEFFAARDPRIATAANKAARSRLITELIQENPALHGEFIAAVHAADCVSKFLRHSERFPLTAVGDINTYAVFAETIRRSLGPSGRATIILPTGIATDATCQQFFADLNEKRALASLFDFENREHLFAALHTKTKFCLITLSKERIAETQFAFFCQLIKHLSDARRRFTLAPEDLELLNPNTHTCPIFRTRADADLTRKIYQRVPVLIRDGQPDGNLWGISFMRMFDMANDSGLFRTASSNGLPLYEAKMMWHFDHRFTTYEGATQEQLNASSLPQLTPNQKANTSLRVMPRYWLDESDVLNRVVPPMDEEQAALADGSLQRAELERRQRERAPHWLLGFRDVTDSRNERSAVFSLLPFAAVGHKLPLVFIGASFGAEQLFCLLANVNSFVFDYVVRQKIGAMSLSYFILKQIPVLPPTFYRAADVAYLASRVLELVYTADDMQPLSDALRASPHSQYAIPNSPFRWDETRRALLRAELDAWFARAYGLTRDELRYILDPADVYGPDFPGETFRVLKQKEQAKYGEYRTRRLVLEAWDKLPPQTS
jgi:methylase of polypeptide subunit release factors